MQSKQTPAPEQHAGMYKYEIYFKDGKHCTMLTDQCRTTDEAFAAARERFGDKVVCAK